MPSVSPWPNSTGFGGPVTSVLFAQGDAHDAERHERRVVFAQADAADGEQRGGGVLFSQGDAGGALG